MPVIHVGGLTPRDITRLARILTILGRHGFGEVVQRLRLHESLPMRVLKGLRLISNQEVVSLSLGIRLRNALTELGPTFVKLGQILSTRPDILPAEICMDLSDLQDKVDPFPIEQVRTIFLEELGRLPEDVFQRFDDQPAAAASLSQVHKALLHDSRTVAVKIQRPGARAKIEADLGLLRFAAQWIHDHASLDTWIDPIALVSEFQRSIRRELNFQNELRHIQCFRKNFDRVPTVHVPDVFKEFSSQRILTMEWIDGTSVDELAELKRMGMDLPRIALNGARAVLKQIFQDGFFHADPHPGNIFILPGELVCFLDYGMAASLDPADADAIADIIAALFSKNASRIAKVILRVTESQMKLDRAALERDIREYLFLEADEVIKGMRFGQGLRQVTDLMHQHSLQFPPRFTLLLKSLATIERVGHELDPDFDMVPVTRPYVTRLIKKRYSLKRILTDLRETLAEAFLLGKNLPGEVREIFTLLRQGDLRVAFQHRGLEELIHVMDRASNRIAFSVIIGALIVGSSLVMHASRGPTIWGAPALGLIGYFVAALFGIWLVISIIRSRKL